MTVRRDAVLMEDLTTSSTGQGRSKLFKSEGDGCDLFINNRNDGYNDRGVQHVSEIL